MTVTVQEIKLGSKVRDTISGLEGTAVSRTTFLYGCVRIGVQPVGLHDGKPVEGVWFDEPQLELVKESEIEPAAPRHGPRPDVKRATDASR